MEKFIILHTPKCGGTSLSFQLNQHYKDYIHYDYKRPEQNNFTIEMFKTAKGYLVNKNIIFGHFIYYKFPKFLFKGYNYITFIRDPFSRAISHFYYWKKNPDRKNKLCKKMLQEDWSISKFLFNPRILNFYSFYMPFNSHQKFDYFIVQEKFSDCLLILKNKFKVFNIIRNKQFNVGNYEKSFNFDQNLEREFKKKAIKDYKIYEFGLDNFSKNFKNMSNN